MIVEICVGSSCHLKGAGDIVEMLQKCIEEQHLDLQISLKGSFCTGRCNRIGVTVTVDGEVHTGITKENFPGFFEESILKPLKTERT